MYSVDTLIIITKTTTTTTITTTKTAATTVVTVMVEMTVTFDCDNAENAACNKGVSVVDRVRGNDDDEEKRSKFDWPNKFSDGVQTCTCSRSLIRGVEE